MKLGAKITVALILGLLIISFVGVRSYLVIQRLTESKDWVDHTHEVLQNLERVQSVVMMAETGARGFVLTGDAQFLAPYDSAIAEFQNDVASVKYLTRDNPDQQRDLEQLQKLCSEKLDILKDFIQHRREGGLEAALPIISSGKGERITDEIRDLVAVMEQRENRLLDARSRDAGKVARQSMLTLGLGVLLSLAILGVAGVILIRTVRLADRNLRLGGAGRKWPGTAVRYAFAAAVIALAAWLKSWLEQHVGPVPMFITFYPAVLLAATVAGGGPGVVATVLTVLAADYWFVAPTGSFSIAHAADAVSLGIFAGAGIFLSLLAERLRRARVAEVVGAAQEKELALVNLGNLLARSLDDRIIRWSDGNRRLYGYDAEETEGKPASELLQTHFDRPLEQIHADLELNGRWEGEVTRRTKDGTRIPVALLWALRRDERGKPLDILEVSTDITRQKSAEEALREMNLTLEKRVVERTEELRATALYARSLLEASLDPLVTISPDGNVTDVNAATESATGVPRAQLVGTHFSDYFTEPSKANAGYQQVLRDGTVRDYPLTVRHASGRTTDVLYNATVYRNEAGAVQGVFAAARDVTEHNRMEAQLRVASLYARSLLEASFDPLVTISPDGKITDVNKATEEATGIPRQRLIGTDFSSYFTDPERAGAGYRKVLSDGFVRDYPLTVRHSAGRTADVLYNATIYRNEAGEVQGVFAAARDVTERNKMEQELARYRLQLEELVKQRTSELEKTAAELSRSNKDLEQFAYVASHDLQEPLRAVGGFASLLKQQLKDRLDADGQKYIGHVVEGAERMQALINDLLTYSRVGSRGGARTPVDMKQALDDAVGNLSAAIEASRAVIRSDPLPTIAADPSQMVQLLQNLVGNAIKFHGPRAPDIHIGARREKDAWVFSVRDNGIGIEPKYHDRIFLIFQRLHSRLEYPGTGIGLAVCKKIVERHSGRIWFESQPGEGTTFFFTIFDKRSDE